MAPPRGELNLDQTGMCHWRLKFITLFWSGQTQKGYPALDLSQVSVQNLKKFCMC